MGVPWGVFTEENFNIKEARKILDRDHYGLEEVKTAILEFIAVGKLRGSVHGKILCLSGPPGTGTKQRYSLFLLFALLMRPHIVLHLLSTLWHRQN